MAFLRLFGPRLGRARAAGPRTHLHRARSAALGVGGGARRAKRCAARSCAGGSPCWCAGSGGSRCSAWCCSRFRSRSCRSAAAASPRSRIRESRGSAASRWRARTRRCRTRWRRPRPRSMPMPAAPPPRALGDVTRERAAAQGVAGRLQLLPELGAGPEGAHHHRPGASQLELALGRAALARTGRARSDAAAGARAALAEPRARLLARGAARGADRGACWSPLLPGGGLPLRRAASALAALAALLLAAPPRRCRRGSPGPRAAERAASAPAREARLPSGVRRQPAASPRGRALRTSAAHRDRRRGADRGPAAGQRARLGAGAGDRRRRAGHGAAPRRRRRAVAAGRRRRAPGAGRRRRSPIATPSSCRCRSSRTAWKRSSRGWSVQGIGPDGAPEDNLQLTRLRDASAGARPALEPSALPGLREHHPHAAARAHLAGRDASSRGSRRPTRRWCSRCRCWRASP